MVKLTPAQRNTIAKMASAYEEDNDANRLLLSLSGQVQWRTNRAGQQYLYRTHGKFQPGANLGLRSAATEQLEREFSTLQASAFAHKKEAATKASEIASEIRGLDLGCIPVIAQKIMRTFDEHSLLDGLVTLGTHCLIAYSFHAGVNFARTLEESRDLMDGCEGWLLFGGTQLPDKQLLFKLLKQTERTFEVVSLNPFKTRTIKGFAVAFTEATPAEKTAGESELEDDLPTGSSASEEPTVQWLIGQPRLRVIIPGSDGHGLPLCVPNIQAFIVHKAWRAEKPSRPQAQRDIDASHADFAIALLRSCNSLSHIEPNYLRMLPRSYRMRCK